MSGTKRPGASPVGAAGTTEVSGRDRAVLRAVAAGRCLLRAGCEPLLTVDGLSCADSAVARRLIDAGLLAQPATVVERARLTPAGRAALEVVQI
jgi:hypothetical protein